MKNVEIVCVSLLILVSVNNFCFADDSTSQPAVRLITGEGYFPFADKDIVHGGWSRALVMETFALMNVEVDIDVLPWTRGLKWTKDGHVLATFPYVYSDERAEEFYYSVAINHVPVHLFVTQESGVTSIDELKNKRLCIPYGYSIESIPKSIPNNLRNFINHAKDGVGCLTQIQKGWSDVGMTNGYIDPEELKTASDINVPIYILPEVLASVPLHLIISKRHPNAQKWIDRFNDAFAELSSSGKKQQIDLQFITLLSSQ